MICAATKNVIKAPRRGTAAVVFWNTQAHIRRPFGLCHFLARLLRPVKSYKSVLASLLYSLPLREAVSQYVEINLNRTSPCGGSRVTGWVLLWPLRNVLIEWLAIPADWSHETILRETNIHVCGGGRMITGIDSDRCKCTIYYLGN